MTALASSAPPQKRKNPPQKTTSHHPTKPLALSEGSSNFVKVYNQEMPSWPYVLSLLCMYGWGGCTTKCKPLITLETTKARLARKHFKGPARFKKTSWMHETKIYLLRKVMIKSICMVEPGHYCLLMMWPLIEITGWSVKCAGLHCLLIFVQMLQNELDRALQCKWIITQSKLQK